MPTVLIVEDNRALADAVAEVLRSIGYGTLIAHDGEAALSVVERSEGRSPSSTSNYQRSTDWRWRVDYARATASGFG